MRRFAPLLATVIGVAVPVSGATAATAPVSAERIVATVVDPTVPFPTTPGPFSPPLNIAAIGLDGSSVDLTKENPAEDWYGSISGDGTRIAYVRRAADNPTAGEYDIWVMGADGSTKVNVTRDGTAATETFPNFSPDSTWIAFARHFETSGPSQPGTRPRHEPWAVFADGTQVRLGEQLPGTASNPVISPDGSRIATTIDGDIWISAPDGSNAFNLTRPLFPEGSESWLELEADFAPDGGSLAFQVIYRQPSGGPPPSAGPGPDVYRVNLDGTGLALLTPGDEFGSAPTFSPDGTHIAYAAPSTGSVNAPNDIWVMGAADGSDKRQITNTETAENWPDWGHLLVPPPAKGELDECDEADPTLPGTGTEDILPGTRGGDVIAGKAGDDQLVGGVGRDVLCASDGHVPDADALDGGGSKDLLDGGPGPDLLVGGPGDDLLVGGRGADRCKGGSGKDRLRSC